MLSQWKYNSVVLVQLSMIMQPQLSIQTSDKMVHCHLHCFGYFTRFTWTVWQYRICIFMDTIILQMFLILQGVGRWDNGLCVHLLCGSTWFEPGTFCLFQRQGICYQCVTHLSRFLSNPVPLLAYRWIQLMSVELGLYSIKNIFDISGLLGKKYQI